jgi:hypothetical protein
MIVHTIVGVVDGLTEGKDNHVQFRGLDRVGNGPATSEEFMIIVDTEGPEIDVDPRSNVVHPERDVTFTIRVSDHISGVAIDRVQYRTGLEGDGSLGKWQRVPVRPHGDNLFVGSVSVRFDLGRENRIQFRCYDKLGNLAESEILKVWVNSPPSALIQWPANGSTHVGGLDDKLCGLGSHDPDGDPLTYLWFINGKEMPPTDDPEMEVDLTPGHHHIILIVKDPYGGWGDYSITVTIEESSTGLTTMTGFLLFVIMISTIVGVTLYLRWRHQRET